VLGSDEPVNGLQEAQLVERLLILRYVVLGSAIHCTSFQRRGVFTVDLTPPCAAGLSSGGFSGASALRRRQVFEQTFDILLVFPCGQPVIKMSLDD
jgi:hypothetical protein